MRIAKISISVNLFESATVLPWTENDTKTDFPKINEARMHQIVCYTVYRQLLYQQAGENFHSQ
jgi:hypothetical protein